MNDDLTKVFDVSRPSRVNPDNTARPIIVGHRPSMPDPMMRPEAVTPRPPDSLSKAAPAEPAAAPDVALPPTHTMVATPSASPQEGPALEPHHAKVISVSDSVRSEIAASQPSLPAPAEPVTPAPAVPDPLPTPPMPAIINPSPKPAETAGSGSISPAAIPPAPPLATPTASPPITNARPEPEIHHQSLPMGHASATSAGRLKHFVLWLFVLLFLGAFVGYLAIDAGFVSSSIKLPFHIFDRQT